jgi:hypothetical protein
MVSLFLCFFQQIVFILALHPIHVSVTEILYDEKEKELEMTVRVFSDDLETTLRKSLNDSELDLLNPKGKTVDQMMEEYFKTHFNIRLDNQVQDHHYLGHEVDGEAFVFYIQVSKVKKWKSIFVLNDILIDQFEDQSNLVHVTVVEEVKSLRLTKNARSGVLSF